MAAMAAIGEANRVVTVAASKLLVCVKCPQKDTQISI